MVTAAVLIAFVMLAVACVSVFGVIVGPVIWLLLYSMFLASARAIRRYVDPH
jgi:hypothetical protein